MHEEDVFIMGQRIRYNFNLLLFLTAGIVATVFSSECAQAKVKTTIKNGGCIVSGKGAMTDDYGYNKEIKKVIIKDGVTSLPEEAFTKCRNLKEVSIADSVKKIGAYAFMGTDLHKITIPNSVKKMGDGVLNYCKNLEKIKMPGNVKLGYSDEIYRRIQYDLGSPVKTIQLTSSLNLNTFTYLAAENVIVSKKDPRYTSIDGLIYTKDGKSLVRIPSHRKTAVIAEGCTEFCTNAIEWCAIDSDKGYTGCQKLKSVVLPKSIQTIDVRKFAGDLQPVPFYDAAATGKKYLSFTLQNKDMTWEQISLLHNKFNTPYLKLYKQVSGAFGPGSEQGFVTSKNGTALLKYIGKENDVHIPQGITQIGEGAFSGAPLTEVTIPKSVIIIDSDAFLNCKKLAKVTFEGTPSVIACSAFTERSVLIEPGSIAIQYTWAVPCNIKGSRSYYTISFYCLPLEGADGYELQISTAENFAKNKTKTFNVKKDGKRVCRRIPNYLSNMLYYRVRPYKLMGQTKFYGQWTHNRFDPWSLFDKMQ